MYKGTCTYDTIDLSNKLIAALRDIWPFIRISTYYVYHADVPSYQHYQSHNYSS